MTDAKKKLDIDEILKNVDWKKMFGPTPQQLADAMAKVLNRIDAEKSASEEYEE